MKPGSNVLSSARGCHVGIRQLPMITLYVITHTKRTKRVSQLCVVEQLISERNARVLRNEVYRVALCVTKRTYIKLNTTNVYLPQLKLELNSKIKTTSLNERNPFHVVRPTKDSLRKLQHDKQDQRISRLSQV